MRSFTASRSFGSISHIIPTLIAFNRLLAIIARITRSSLLDVLGLDYIRTARAKGLAEPSVVRKHGLPNAMLPVVTIVGLQVGGLLAGAVLTETIFNLAGVGKPGQLVEMDDTDKIFSNPTDKRTEDYISGRFG